MTAPGSPRHAAALDDGLRLIHACQDRFRDPGLTVLLVVQLCLIFLAAPLAAKGLPIARQAGETLVLAVVVIVVMLSRNRGAIALIVLGMAATLASFSLGWALSPITISVLRRGGDIVTFSALIWVVSLAVYAPGRISYHRLQGAAVVYLNIATIFSAAFTLIWEVSPAAFANFALLVFGVRLRICMSSIMRRRSGLIDNSVVRRTAPQGAGASSRNGVVRPEARAGRLPQTNL
jgi:hypothetical protein